MARPAGRPTAAGRLYPILLALAVTVGATSCSDNADSLDDALILVLSSDLAVGRERVLISAIDSENRSLVTDRPVHVTFFAPDGTAREEIPARFIWAIPEARGMWVAKADFDTPGIWTLALRPGDGDSLQGVPFAVTAQPRTVGVGDPAPPSLSKTVADGPLESMTSDPAPDPRLYETSVADAVASGRPSVIAFATPAFCTSQTCGPALETVKSLIDDYSGVNWVHVEVYENLDAAGSEDLILATPVTEWGLPNEPWVFVADGSGVVTHRFEGTVGAGELQEALDEVTSG